jgi:hypothetical protein
MYIYKFSLPLHQPEVSGQLHAPSALPPGTHWIGDWVDPRAGLDDVEKILDPTGTRSSTPPSSSP